MISSNCFARILLVILFPFSLTVAQKDECANPRSAVCRDHIASVTQASFAAQLPDLRVHAFDDVMVFAAPKEFKNQEDRAAFRNVLQKEGLEKALCDFGFKEVRVESSANAVLDALPGEQYDISCSDPEGNKPFEFRGVIPGTTTLATVKEQTSGLECVAKAHQRQVNCISKGINEEYFYMFADGILAGVQYSFHHLRYPQY